jgi:hypothetical protein
MPYRAVAASRGVAYSIWYARQSTNELMRKSRSSAISAQLN